MYKDIEKKENERTELEKRKYKRVEKLLLGRFRVKQYEGQKMSSRDWYSVAVENLSAEGMLFNHNNNLEIDSFLDLEVYTSTSIPTIKCAGKLIRIIEESQPLLRRDGPPLKSMFSIATEFTVIDEQKKEIINTTVEEILRKETEKRRFILEKLEKMTNSMTRRVAMAEAKQENTTTLGMKTNKKRTGKKESVSVAETTRNVGIKKEYFKTKDICRVTFRLPKKEASDAKNVCIVGDFNNWNIHANPMKKLKNGDYTIKLDLESEREYQYRFFIDESKWENDWNADKYVRSLYGDSDNSVVMTEL